MLAFALVTLAAATHYEKPPCGSDEIEGQIGQGGVACLPSCSMATSCPTDVPSGVTAKPECALQDASSGKMYCGLICHDDSVCGDAKCQILQGNIGVCTYEQAKKGGLEISYQPIMSEKSHKSEFENWMQKYDKAYKSDEERATRFAIFVENRVYAHRMNTDKDQTATFELNEFADMTWEEFRAIYVGGYKPSLEKQWHGVEYLGTFKYSGAALPDEVDWTTKGAVTPVKNQQQCGSCWAFSTTGSLEGAWQIANGKLVSFSEQQLVDCSHDGNMGCRGGLMDNAFKYVKSSGICTEESYPYKASDGTCQAKTCTAGIPAGGVTGYQDVKQDDEQALMEAVSKGPVSIAIEADHRAFQLYKGGVLKQACGTQLDHGVLLVGYGKSADGTKYWKVKNSWGASWGMQGYIELEMDNSPDGKAGECGLMSQPSFPVVKSGPVPPSPTPPSPTPPSPTPPSPSPSTHYEKPPCQSDETEASVQGIDGSLCAPKCAGQNQCPSDKPPKTLAFARCMLQDQSGDQYCALQCFADFMCPQGSKCGKVGLLTGVCAYPDSRAGPNTHKMHIKGHKEEEIVV
jgi:KDEL-tailed cysteine endopeptidase